MPLALPPPPRGRRGISSATCGAAVAVGAGVAAGAVGGEVPAVAGSSSSPVPMHEEDDGGDHGEDGDDEEDAAQPRRGRRPVRGAGGRLVADRPRAGGHGRGGGRDGRVALRRLGCGRPGRAGSGCPVARDGGQGGALHAGQAVGHAGRPGAGGRGLREQAAGRVGVARRLLAQQPVRERPRDLARQPVRGRERRQAGLRAVADRVDGDPEQRRDVVVGAALLQHERDDRALVRGEGLEGAHATAH